MNVVLFIPLLLNLKNLIELYKTNADHLQVIRRLAVGFCRVPVDFCIFVLDNVSAKEKDLLKVFQTKN